MTHHNKSTVDEIRHRFDNDVERFSNLESGQSATVDAPLALSLIAEAAALCTPHAKHILDIGCGAGNFTLRTLEHIVAQEVTLIDLSRPMLNRATERVTTNRSIKVNAVQNDIREVDLPAESIDIVLAGAVLHHLRTDLEWHAVFTKILRALRPGGSFWIFDMIQNTIAPIQSMMWRRYGEYLAALKDETYRDHVFAYIEQEDTPRPLLQQIDDLRAVGFREVDILHKNTCFAAFGALK